MKKWIGAICSGLAGVLSLILLAIPTFKVDYAYLDKSYSGWNLLTTKDFNDIAKLVDKDTLTALTWYRVFAWILIVLAIVMIVVAVLQILANLNIIKVPAIVDTVAKYALIALAVVSVLVLIANFGIRSEVIDVAEKIGGKENAKQIAKYYKTGVGLWLVAIANIASAVCANLFAKKAK